MISSKLALLSSLTLVLILFNVVIFTSCSSIHPIAGESRKDSGDDFSVWPVDNLNQSKNNSRLKRQTQKPRPSSSFSPVNVEFDANNFINKVEGWVKSSNKGQRKGFVKSLMEKASFEAPNGYHVMVFNMNQEYQSGFSGVIAHLQVHEYDSYFGIWVFKCGTFMNKGERGWENWAYAGHYYNFARGGGVIFHNPDCPNPAYKPFNHYYLPGKDYHIPSSRIFHDVESNEECAAWTLEINESISVYHAPSKKCHVKPTNYNGGVTNANQGVSYDKHGNRLGQYDVVFRNEEETRDEGRRQQWINEEKCDLIHTLKHEKLHFCRVFERLDGSTLLFRRN